MLYKGYEVIERVFQYASIGGKDDEGLVLNAPCGCRACRDEVQPGHFACDSYPEWMDSDKNLHPRLLGDGWVWEYTGPVQ